MILTSHEVGYWVAEKLKCNYDENNSYSIGYIKDNITCGVIYENWNGSSITCHIACDGLFGNRDFLYTIFHYPFVYLDARKIIAPISSSNKKSIKLVENMGFELEGIIKDAFLDGDSFIFTMNKYKCRFLGVKYGKKLSIATTSS